MSNKNIKVENTTINEVLYNFINNEVLPDTDVSENDFWNGFVKAVNELAPINKELLKKRDVIQSKIDEWHKSNKEKIDFSSYKNFLKEIGYLVEDQGDFKIETSNVDDEIAKIAGPQLVVPIDNARYALNRRPAERDAVQVASHEFFAFQYHSLWGPPAGA